LSKPFDYKKENKDLYMPKNKPILIDIPNMSFIMIDGEKDPNNNREFEKAVEVLYGLSYTIKMSKNKGYKPQGYYDYVVPPLEGLWWIKGGEFSIHERENWKWTLMIRQPEFVSPEIFQWACNGLKTKKPELPIDKARLEVFEEGLCVQAMHIGPYSTEPETIKMIEDYIHKNKLKLRFEEGGKHHEIYLSNPEKCKPEGLKTVLRHPVSHS
jgi:hypothetical protein